jgi:hypothetical protein
MSSILLDQGPPNLWLTGWMWPVNHFYLTHGINHNHLLEFLTKVLCDDWIQITCDVEMCKFFVQPPEIASYLEMPEVLKIC